MRMSESLKEGISIVVFLFLVLFAFKCPKANGQTRIFSPDKPDLMFTWHDPNPPEKFVDGYYLHFSYDVIDQSEDTLFTKIRTESMPDSFQVYVTCYNHAGESAGSNILTILFRDTVEYEPTWPISDIPIYATAQEMQDHWFWVEPTIRRSNISLDIPSNKIYLMGGLGPAFIERYVNISQSGSYTITIFPDRYAGSILKIGITKDPTETRTFYPMSVNQMAVDLIPGKWLLSVEAFDATVVLRPIQNTDDNLLIKIEADVLDLPYSPLNLGVK